MTDDPLLKPKEAATILGVSVETIHRWIRKGAIPHVRIGSSLRKRLRVRRSVVDAQLQEINHPGDCST